MPTFIGRLLYALKDTELRVDRLKVMYKKPSALEVRAYDFGIAYEHFAAGSCRDSFEVTPIPSSAISFLRILFDMLGQN